MTHAALSTPPAEKPSQPETLNGFPLDHLTPRVCREARAILARITQARSLGRKKADIRNMDGCRFATRNDIHPLTLALFEACRIYICEYTLPAATNDTMSFTTPEVVILQAEWICD